MLDKQIKGLVNILQHLEKVSVEKLNNKKRVEI